MRPAIGLLAITLIFAPFVGSSPRAAETEQNVGLDRQTGLALTIYQLNLALVQDQRTVSLDEGINHIAFEGVSAELQPETIVLEGETSGPVELIEQRYLANVISPEELLQASVGQQVRVAIVNPKTGEEKIEPATVLSATGGVVLKMGDRIETQPPGRLIYDSIPANLREKPTLVFALKSARGSTASLALGYLTGGLAWSANYVAELDASETNLSLSARASITNESGAAYRNARLTLVAGNPSRIAEARPLNTLRAADATVALAAKVPSPSTSPGPEAVSEFYRYAVDRQTSIGERETVQLALFDAAAVPVKKEYFMNDSAPVTSPVGSDPTPVPVISKLNFDNKKSGGLGTPLPGGIVRAYERSPDGSPVLLGEDRIAETPVDKPVKLTLGQAFDVTAERRQTNVERPTDRSYEANEEITLHNAKNKSVTVAVVENLPGDWRILDESESHEKVNSSVALWRVDVPANGEHKLTFHVESRF
ncbi:MAG TPA: DUF4139 domain-containing protein [Alphaproteobacteria bacterium]|nr:DUF4139 domain-containing protein [Alphaproteobacteria bacterium]